jgi:alpha-glucosidase
MYRTALRLRRELDLGSGSLAWWHWPPDSSRAGDADVVAFINNGVGVLANLRPEPVRLPEGAEILCTSIPLADDPGLVPPDVTVWLRPGASS